MVWMSEEPVLSGAWQTEQRYCWQVYGTHYGMSIWGMVLNLLRDILKGLVGMCETYGILRVKTKGKNGRVKFACEGTSVEKYRDQWIKGPSYV